MSKAAYFISISCVVPFWIVSVASLYFRILRAPKEKMLRENHPLLAIGRCHITRVAISEKQGESAGSSYKPMLEYFFEEDPKQVRYGLQDPVYAGSIASAYDDLLQFVPQGTPFEFISHREKLRKPLFSRPIISGDRLSQFLTDEDHAFIINTKWSDSIPNPFPVKYFQGDFSMNGLSVSQKPGMIWGEICSSILITAFFIWICFYKQGLFSLSPFMKTSVVLEIVALLALWIWWEDRSKRSDIPSKPIFSFIVSASTLREITP